MLSDRRKGPELFGVFFVPFAASWSWKVNMFEFKPPIFHGICKMLVLFAAFLELEAAASTVFAACLNSNLSFSMEFATFWRVNSSWKTVVCNKGSFRVGFKISLGFLYGLNLGVLSVGFRVRVWLGSI